MNKLNKVIKFAQHNKDFKWVSPNSTENAHFSVFCGLKIIQALHGKHL